MVRVAVVAVLALVLVVVVVQTAVASPYTVTVKTDKSTYAPGEKVKVSGSVSPAAVVTLGWELYDPNGRRKDFGQVTTGADGKFSFTISTSSSWPLGTYKIVVVVSGTSDKGSVTFTLKKPEAPPPTPPAPAPVDYKTRAKNQINKVKSMITVFNSSLGEIVDLLDQLNVTFEPESLLNMLQQATGQLEEAEQQFAEEKYEEAYTIAKDAEETVGDLYEELINTLKLTMLQVAQDLLGRTNETYIKSFLEETIQQIESIRPSPDVEELNKVIDSAYQLVVASRAIEAPALEKRLRDLVKQLEALKTDLVALNQTYRELQKEYKRASERIKALISQLNELQMKYNELAESYASLKQDHEGLKKAYEELQREAQELRQRPTLVHLAIASAVALALGYVVGTRLKLK